MNKFEIGEIAVAISIMGRPPADVELIRFEKDLISFDGKGLVDAWSCRVVSSGEIFNVRPENLRKKQPPQELGSWDAEVFKELNWNPTKENEHAN